jgi:CHAT domain-containing protein/tetratricopeptide (TPR) repeat protein
MRQTIAILFAVIFGANTTAVAGQDPAPQAEKDPIYAVDKQDLILKGRIAADDPKVKYVGGETSGKLPSKRFQVTLEAGKRYEVSMSSPDFDSFLVAQDAAGKQLALDDDNGGGLDALVVLHVDAQGRYQIYAASLHQGTGSFTLRIRALPKAAWLTAERRQALENKRSDATNRMLFAYALRQFPKASKAALEALDAVKELYPEDDYPNGHLDVANALDFAGQFQSADGKLAEAEPLLRSAAKIHERLIKGDNPQVAFTLNNLANLLHQQGNAMEADALSRRSLEMRQRLFKGDHPELATSLNNIAVLLTNRGKAAEAEPYFRDALAMYRRLIKRDHIELAGTMNNLASALRDQGKWSEAESLYSEALEMYKRMFKKGDASLATCLNNLGTLRQDQSKLTDAEQLYRDALEMRQRIFTNDHHDVAMSLNNLGNLFQQQRNLTEAEFFYRKALLMRQRISRSDHPSLATSLNNFGALLQDQGKFQEAEVYYRDALAMRRRLFNGDHAYIAGGLYAVGLALEAQGKLADAVPFFQDALRMNRRLAVLYAEANSEGEALTFVGNQPRYLDGVVNARERSAGPGAVYDEVLRSKALLGQIHARRRQAARAGVSDNKTASLVSELTETRRRRAELILAPFTNNAGVRQKRVDDAAELGKRVGQIESELRPLLPALPRAEKLAGATSADLQKALPAESAVIDFLEYSFDAATPNAPRRYLAFVVTRDRITRVELESVTPIEKAVREWREAIVFSKVVPPDLPLRVRELIWEKVRKELPPGIKTVYIAPDTVLTAVPWAALPGDRKGTILLEDFAVAVVPHVPFLLGQFWSDDYVPNPLTGLLALGGVDFDATAPSSGALDVPTNRGVAIKPNQKPNWPTLPGSEVETKGVLRLAADRKLDARLLSGKDATAAALMAELPKARFAHLATHGFFADKEFRSAFQYDPKLFESRGRERIGAGALSPMVLSGLVVAGANRSDTVGRGLVSGEFLIDRDLSGLELAVLSACDTGLGDVAGGEGVFGLQRAFHLAGTRNVAATLWEVHDAATAALIAVFYRELWEKGNPPIEALRLAQLEIYRNPEKVPELAKKFHRTFEVVKSDAPPPLPIVNGRAHPRLWAAFTLSGPGTLRDKK